MNGNEAGDILSAIGNTPMIELKHLTAPGSGRVLLKLEQLNPTGSYKDRMAVAILDAAEAAGKLRPGMTVLEATSGSTGTSLAFASACRGYPIKIVTSDVFAAEKLRSMRAFGAELEIIESPTGTVTPDLMPKVIGRARELAARPEYFWADQFNNPDAFGGYEALGEEILRQAGGSVTALCAAVGTAGMLMGVARVLRRDSPATRIVALEPAESPVLTEGRAGAHRVDGVAGGFRPPLLDDALFDEARAISQDVGRRVTRELAMKEGVFAGHSTGLNVAAALQLAKELGSGSTVVTVAADSGLKYLSGDLFAA